MGSEIIYLCCLLCILKLLPRTISVPPVPSMEQGVIPGWGWAGEPKNCWYEREEEVTEQ